MKKKKRKISNDRIQYINQHFIYIFMNNSFKHSNFEEKKKHTGEEKKTEILDIFFFQLNFN